MRDHGGDIDSAIVRFGGLAADWLDLSTGINRNPYPIPSIPGEAWRALPTASALERLTTVAAGAYETAAAILPVAGAQAAIQLIPRLSPPGEALVLGPTYNEHASSLAAAGWSVTEVSGLEELAGADLAVVVNPNNPDGRRFTPEDLVMLRNQVGRLVVDESFVDPESTLSLAPRLPVEGLLVLRSFGKFYGLAGLRLGFVLGSAKDIAALSALAGPWPVSGAAIEIGTAALRDRGWREENRVRLQDDCQRLDHLAEGAGWRLVGGAALFRTYETPDGGEAQAQLAHGRVWSRIFPYSKTWLRLGLPGDDAEFKQLARALAG